MTITEPRPMLPMPQSLAEVLDAGLDPREEMLSPSSWRLLGDDIREVITRGVDPEACNAAYFWLSSDHVEGMKPEDPPTEKRMIELAQGGLWAWEIRTGRVPLERLAPFVSDEVATIIANPEARMLAVFRSEIGAIAREAAEMIEHAQLVLDDLSRLTAMSAVGGVDPLDTITEV